MQHLDSQEGRFMTLDTAFTRFPTLTTQRLRLRQIDAEDTDAIFAIYSDEETMRFYGEDAHRSPAETRVLIGQMHESYRQRRSIRWGITLKDQTTIIGSCGFHNFNLDAYHVETGYSLKRAFWGQGIMTEAMHAVLTFGFSELGLHRIEAIIDIANTRSKNLLLKLGFTYEGSLRQRFYFHDQFEDEHFFSLLADEWKG
jgi:ribosomal-protein-alanine N-acetyltransferase